MAAPTSPTAVLDALLSLGTRMQAALQIDDLDAFYGLVDERGQLIEQLHLFTGLTERPTGWADAMQALEEQHELLFEALDAQENRLLSSLADLDRLRHATHTYGTPVQLPAILNRELRG